MIWLDPLEAIKTFKGMMGHIVQLQVMVQIGNDQEKAQSERNSHSKSQGGKNLIDN